MGGAPRPLWAWALNRVMSSGFSHWVIRCFGGPVEDDLPGVQSVEYLWDGGRVDLVVRHRLEVSALLLRKLRVVRHGWRRFV